MTYVVLEITDLVKAEQLMHALPFPQLNTLYTFAFDREDAGNAVEALWEEFPEAKDRVYVVVLGKHKRKKL